MDTTKLIAEIDAEIARLQQVKSLLTDTITKRSAGRSKISEAASARQKRRLSPEARERIAAAQRKRWATVKRAAK
jgi:hypothetical protein